MISDEELVVTTGKRRLELRRLRKEARGQSVKYQVKNNNSSSIDTSKMRLILKASMGVTQRFI